MCRTILVVDDSPIARKMIIRTLKMVWPSELRFLQAGDGAEALTVLAAETVDLVVTDLNMPGMDGFQFVAHLREDKKLAGMPVIVISTEGSKPRLATLIEFGIEGILRKPFKPEKARPILERLFGPCEPEAVDEDEGMDFDDDDEGAF